MGARCRILGEKIVSDEFFTREAPKRLPRHSCDMAIRPGNKGRANHHHLAFKGLKRYLRYDYLRSAAPRRR